MKNSEVYLDTAKDDGGGLCVFLCLCVWGWFGGGGVKYLWCKYKFNCTDQFWQLFCQGGSFTSEVYSNIIFLCCTPTPTVTHSLTAPFKNYSKTSNKRKRGYASTPSYFLATAHDPHSTSIQYFALTRQINLWPVWLLAAPHEPCWRAALLMLII